MKLTVLTIMIKPDFTFAGFIDDIYTCNVVVL